MNQFDKSLEHYRKAVESISGMELKGKTMPYTSADGHMFSQLNKDGELGVRLSKSDREIFYKEHGEEPFLSYGAVMKEYVKIPEGLMENVTMIVDYLEAGFAYVSTLKPK